MLAATGIAALGLVGLPLAIIGVFFSWLVFPLVGVAWVWLTTIALGLTRHERASAGSLPSVIALHFAMGFGLFAALHSSEHVLVDRDPAVYLMTGKWLANHGNLVYEPGLPNEVISSVPHRAWSSAGMYPHPNGTASFQFTHLLGVTLGTANLAGGDALMLVTPAALAAAALLGVFVVTRAIAGGGLGLLAMAALSMHPATIHLAKDAYSEWLALIALCGAALLWMKPPANQLRRHHAAIGVLLGLCAAARVDGWLTVACFLGGIAYWVMTAAPENRNHTRRGLPWLLGGIATSSLVAFVDLTLRSPGYLGHLWPRLRVTLLAVGAALVLLSAVALRFKGPRAPLGRQPRSVLAVLAATTVVALSALAIRSALSTGAPDEVDPGVPLQWFSWYQGWPMVIVALAAGAFAAHHMIRTAGHRAIPLMTTLIGVGTAFLARPQISLDQLWAMRRFMPVVLPFMFVFVAWAVGHVWAAGQQRGKAVAVALVAGLPLTTGFVIMAKTAAPTATLRMQAGMIEQIESVCDVLPSDSVVMITGRSALVFSVPIRIYCDVGVMRGASHSRHDLVVAAGRSPVVIADGTSCLLGEQLGLFAIRHTQPERPTGRPPAGESRPRTEHFEVTALSGPAPREERATTPLIELETTLAITAHPETSVSLDRTANAAGSITIDVSPSGHVTAALDSDQYGTASIRLGTAPADGLPRMFGAYLADGRLHATCGGVTIGSTTVGA